jgi:DNA repair exonuclease SbcCD ATPase subunit
VAHDSSLFSIGRDGETLSSGSAPIGQDPLVRVRENIARLAESRLREDMTPEQLTALQKSLKQALSVIFTEDKGYRVERARLTAARDNLRAKNLELKKLRMAKNVLISEKKAALKSLKGTASQPIVGEVERLERRMKDLTSDVDDLEDTFRVQKRERDRVFKNLVTASDELQDLLTELILWRIQELHCEPLEGGGRKGMSGVCAEFLGRLLVLESEGAQVSWILEKTPDNIEKSER